MSLMPVVIPDMMDDSSESTPAFLEDGTTFDLSPQQTNISSVDGQSLIRRDREREGRCGDCGMQTYDWRWDPLTNVQVKLPLTIPQEVHRGRCLLCHPIFSPGIAQQQRLSQPSHRSSVASSPSLGANVDDAGQQPPVQYTIKKPRVFDHASEGCRGSSLDSDPNIQVALTAIQRADICDLLSVMKRVPHVSLIQERACERLWILSWDDDIAVSIGRVGGIDLILRAMARFAANGHLQQCACEALQNLAVHECNRREIAESGGISLIVQAMLRHAQSAEIQQCACTALASLAFDYQQDICRVGGLHAVIHAAKRFCREDNVLRAAFDAARSMGVDPNGRLPAPLHVTM